MKAPPIAPIGFSYNIFSDKSYPLKHKKELTESIHNWRSYRVERTF